MTSPAAISRRRLVSGLVGGVLALAAVAATLALARRPRSMPTPLTAGAVALEAEVVLETTVALDRGAVDRRLLAPGACRFDVEVTAGVPVTVTFGPPAPSTANAEGGPAAETATAIEGSVGGTVTGSVRVYAAGIQVLRVEPVDPKAGGKAVIRVRRRPGG